MRRRAPIPPLTVEMVPMYRCGSDGDRFLDIDDAYQDAARAALFGAEPPWLNDVSAVGFKRRRATLVRLARWLRWRDGRLAAMAAETKGDD